ncbi:hypothetical protein M0P65_01550 [Candidatus Gracilibacteria bacterium]|nr:hypothetical protein [Candidatus Gracilibacteria bacterium]
MISFIRAIQPQLMGLFWTLCFVWTVALIVRKNLPEAYKEFKKVPVRVALIMSAIATVSTIVFFVDFAVINEVPRATIDRSAVKTGQSNFEKKMEKEANKPKSE